MLQQVPRPSPNPNPKRQTASRFASRADMIIFMFDAHKLDISDELRSVIDKLKPHQAFLP